MALNSLFCADVPLSNYSLAHACFIAPLRTFSRFLELPLDSTGRFPPRHLPAPALFRKNLDPRRRPFLNRGCDDLCAEVVERSNVNLMSADNLAVIFGPNLMWSRSQASLMSLGYVNACTLLLLTRYDQLFVK